jgi:Putative transposase DNA-binding domain
MSTHCRIAHLALPASQVSLCLVKAAAPDAPSPLPGAGDGAETGDIAATTTRRRRTPSFVCELPLRVGPAEERVLQARLEAARALYNACLGEARRRWLLVKQSRAYQQARTLPRKTPERTEAFRAARAAHAFTEAALQAYAKDCRHASHWNEEHLDAPVAQKLATRAYRAVLRVSIGKAKHVRFKGKHQLDTVEGKSLHGRLAHQIIHQGNSFLLEKVSYRAWQRRDGRSIQRRAPGTFVQILTRLAESAGGQVINVPTRPTKLSQICQCGREKKKPLSLRVHDCPACGIQMQRDLYSAYLIRFVDPKTYLLRTWPSLACLARCGVAPAGGVAAGPSHPSTGKRRDEQSQPRTAAEGCGASEPVVR